MADDTDLVSQVRVEGVEESTSLLDKFGDAGAAAFAKIAASARAQGAVVTKAASAIGSVVDEVRTSFAKIGQVRIFSKDQQAQLKDIGSEFEKFGASLGRTGQALGRFGQRASLITAAIGAAGVAFAKSAGTIAKSVDGENTSLEDNAKRLTTANNAAGEAAARSINLASEQRKLADQYGRGEITLEAYQQALNQSNRDADEATRVANQLATVQARVAEENDKVAKSLAANKEYQKLVDTFGGPLTASILAFGRQVNAIHKQVVDAFGPGISRLVDAVSATINKNATAISRFFASASTEVSAFATKFAPEITKALEALGQAASSVFTGLIAAGPSLLALFNNGLVPAVKAVVVAFGSLADMINSVFGTQLTGGAIIATAAILQFSGALRLLPRLLSSLIPLVMGLGKALLFLWRNSTPLGIAFTALAAALVYLYQKSPLLQRFAAEGFKSIGTLTTSFINFVKYLGTLAVRITTAFTTAWTGMEKGASDTVTSIRAFFTGIGTFFTTLWASITLAASTVWANITAAASAASTAVEGVWQQVASFFTTLWGTISEGGAAVWQAIVAAAQAAWDAIVAGATLLWTGLQAAAAAGVAALNVVWRAVSIAAQAAWTAIVTGFNVVVTALTTAAAAIASALGSVWTTVTDGLTAAATFITDTWNGLVTFFTNVGQQIITYLTSIWTGIVTGFTNAINSVKKTFSDLYDTAVQYLKPIIDLLKTIIGLAGSASSDTSNSGGVRRAQGGPVFGRGTSTSDSIPAWLSNNEFVMRAKAVRKYGSSFMKAINSGRFDPSQLAGFAQGGLVTAMAGLGSGGPRYAYADRSVQNGGNNGPRTTLNLTLDGEDFNGLLAPADVANKLQIHATKKKVTSAGRRPGWQGTN